MQKSTLIFLILLLSALAFHLGRQKSLKLSKSMSISLHSLPNYYGYYAAIRCAIPALVLLCFWLFFETPIITHFVLADLPESMRLLPIERQGLLINDIKNALADNATDIESALLPSVDQYRRLMVLSNGLLSLLAISFALAGFSFAYSRINPELRARNVVEKNTQGLSDRQFDGGHINDGRNCIICIV